MLKFCSICQNKLYFRLKKDGGNADYCKKCSLDDTNDDRLVCFETQVLRKSNEMGVLKPVLNEYSYLDPTLPRYKGICTRKCKAVVQGGDEMASTASALTDILIIRTSDEHLTFTKQCLNCRLVFE